MFAYELIVCGKSVIRLGFSGNRHSGGRVGCLSYEVRLTHNMQVHFKWALCRRAIIVFLDTNITVTNAAILLSSIQDLAQFSNLCKDFL
jgi:hypothetical protein